MSKFNNTNDNKTTNRSGNDAYAMKDKERLVTMTLTSLFGEPKYYGDNSNELVALATKLCKNGEGEFVAKLAGYARNAGNMRSVSHVLCAIISREAHEFTRKAVHAVAVRPDDILEILSCFKLLYKAPFPNALKRQVAQEMKKFNEYQFAKYKGGKKSITFRDVLRICHSVPDNKEMEELFKKFGREFSAIQLPR